jgi:glutamyl-tRNA synthetase
MSQDPVTMLSRRFAKTRIAPTPSGLLHLGNVLSFSVTACLAETSGAAVLLRIDDLDAPRVRAEYVRDIFETLRYLGIPWQEGPRDYEDYRRRYSQRLRMDSYQAALGELEDHGVVYACRCSRSTYRPDHRCPSLHIPLEEPGVSWRLFTDGSTAPGGRAATGTVPETMKDFIVRKKDGMPSYQLTSVVDDDFFGVDLVVRGQDLYDSTLAQRYLSAMLDGNRFRRATCVHHPLIRTHPSGEKLSKSSGATSVRYLREAGLAPREIFARVAEMAGLGHAEDYRALGAAVAGGLGVMGPSGEGSGR